MNSNKSLVNLQLFSYLSILFLGHFALATESHRSKAKSCSDAVYWLKTTNSDTVPLVLEVSQNESEEIQKIPVQSLVSIDGDKKNYLFSSDEKNIYLITLREGKQQSEIFEVSKSIGSEFVKQICAE